MKILVYTFRTFPEIEKLRSFFPDVFIFSSLKKDLIDFEEKIKTEQPDFILGVASINGESRFEGLTLNRFNKKNKIIKSGPENIKLFVPARTTFSESDKYGTSFCNWTMYQIANYIKHNKLKTKLTFCHVNVADIDKLCQIF